MKKKGGRGYNDKRRDYNLRVNENDTLLSTKYFLQSITKCMPLNLCLCYEIKQLEEACCMTRKLHDIDMFNNNKIILYICCFRASFAHAMP